MSNVLVRICADTFIVEIHADDIELHPDLLDEMCTRARSLFLETQAGLPDLGGEDDAGPEVLPPASG